MTPRLLKIAEYVKQGERLADIGTDHAYIPIYLVQKGIINEAVAPDINRAPLQTAFENIKNAGLEMSIKTVLSDGFLSVDPKGFDTAVVAGMGGALISKILENAPRGKTYILQPMKNLPELKAFLCKNGFKIYDEALAEEGSKMYNILAVKDGKCEYHGIELYIGKGLEDDPLLPKYKEKLRKKFKTIILGQEKSLNPDFGIIKYYRMLLNDIKSI